MLPDEKILNELFQPTGALGSFKTKTNLAYMLGLVNEEFYQDLSTIIKIRNHFAHRVDIKRLEQDPISIWIKGMASYRSLVAIRDRPPSPDNKAANFAKTLMMAELDSMRNCFRNCVRFMILRLNEIERTLLAAKEEREKALKDRSDPSVS